MLGGVRDPLHPPSDAPIIGWGNIHTHIKGIMVTQPTYKGRKLPRNDWEGDDFIPGSGGKFVSCVDTSVGRMVAYATNLRTDLDGKIYRHAIIPHDPDGITLEEAATAVHKETGLTLIIPQDWQWVRALNWLQTGQGLVIVGPYGAMPRAYRHQARADFDHAMFVAYRSSTQGCRLWDPLNPNIHRYGEFVPTSVIKDYLTTPSHGGPTGHLWVAYVRLQPTVL